MKIVAIVQARLGSKRLPNKVLAPIGDTPLIEFLLNRLSKSDHISEIVLATSTNEINDQLASVVENLGYRVVRGSENDVLQRYVDTAKATNADVVVRITGDCPFVDPQLVDQMLSDFLLSNIDYFSNTEPPTYPDGFDIEIFSTSALLRSSEIACGSFAVLSALIVGQFGTADQRPCPLLVYLARHRIQGFRHGAQIAHQLANFRQRLS